MAFEWKDSYSVGIDIIDKQHQRLFEIGRQLDELSKSEDRLTAGDIAKVAKELRDYTIYHLRYEEKLLKDVKYPAYDDHKAEHDAFVLKLNDYDLNDAGEETVLDLIDFVFMWITGHILQTDRKYIGYLK